MGATTSASTHGADAPGRPFRAHGWAPSHLPHMMAPKPSAYAPDIGYFQVEFPNYAQLARFLRAQSGPNFGLAILAAPVDPTGSFVNIHPALELSTSQAATSKAWKDALAWYNDQNAAPKAGQCDSSGVVRLRRNDERHEGLTMHPDSSHWGVANKAFAALRPDTLVEGFTTRRPDADAIKALDRIFTAIINKDIGPLQKKFDLADTQVTNQINCVLDWNPIDP